MYRNTCTQFKITNESIDPGTPLPKAIEEKYPAETDMLPPSDVPVENPNPNDILFGRGIQIDSDTAHLVKDAQGKYFRSLLHCYIYIP